MNPFLYLFHFIDFANRNLGSLIGAVMVTLQTPSGPEPRQSLPVAGYSRGALKAEPTIGGYDGISGSVRGVVQARFSDRHDIWGTPLTGDTDDVGLQILCDSRNSAITITLNQMRWGHVRQVLTPVRVADGILHATGPAVGNIAPSASYLIALSEGAPGLEWRAPEG